MDRGFCLAVGQSPAELSLIEDRLQWLGATLPAVAARGADLLLLPELFATGYNIGAQVVTRAQPADGPIAQEIAALAKAHDVAIHYGFPEADGDRIFNAAQCFGPDGKRLAAIANWHFRWDLSVSISRRARPARCSHTGPCGSRR